MAQVVVTLLRGPSRAEVRGSAQLRAPAQPTASAPRRRRPSTRCSCGRTSHPRARSPSTHPDRCRRFASERRRVRQAEREHPLARDEDGAGRWVDHGSRHWTVPHSREPVNLRTCDPAAREQPRRRARPRSRSDLGSRCAGARAGVRVASDPVVPLVVHRADLLRLRRDGADRRACVARPRGPARAAGSRSARSRRSRSRPFCSGVPGRARISST